jgi:hypothetical protein
VVELYPLQFGLVKVGLREVDTLQIFPPAPLQLRRERAVLVVLVKVVDLAGMRDVVLHHPHEIEFAEKSKRGATQVRQQSRRWPPAVIGVVGTPLANSAERFPRRGTGVECRCVESSVTSVPAARSTPILSLVIGAGPRSSRTPDDAAKLRPLRREQHTNSSPNLVVHRTNRPRATRAGKNAGLFVLYLDLNRRLPQLQGSDLRFETQDVQER